MKLDFPDNELRSSPFSIPSDCIHFQLSSIWVTQFLQIRVTFNITRFIGYRVTLESNLHSQIPLGLHLDQSKQLEWVFEPSQGNSISNNRVMFRRTRYLQHRGTLKTTVYTQIPLGLPVDQSNYLGWVGKPVNVTRLSYYRVMLKVTRFLQHRDTLKTTVYSQIPLGLPVDQSNYLGWGGKPDQRNWSYLLASYVEF